MAKRRALLITMGVLLALVAKLILTRYLILGAAFTPLAVASDVAFVVVVVLLVDALAPDHRLGALLTVDVLLTAAMVGSVMYATHYSEVATARLLPLVSQLPSVASAVRLTFRPVLLVYLADIVVLIVAIVVVFVASARGGVAQSAHPSGPPAEPTPLVRLQPVVYALAVPALVVFAFALVSVGRSNAFADSRRAAAENGLFAYQLATLVPRQAEVSGVTDVSDPRAVQATIDRLRAAGPVTRVDGVSRGQFAGKNVLIIQVEALQAAAVGAAVDGKDVMPSLKSYAGRSYYFPNTVANVARGTTVDAEFAENTSLYPPADTAASLEWADRAIPSLPRLLAEEGYETVTLHANTSHFWNRAKFYEALGVLGVPR